MWKIISPTRRDWTLLCFVYCISNFHINLVLINQTTARDKHLLMEQCLWTWFSYITNTCVCNSNYIFCCMTTQKDKGLFSNALTCTQNTQLQDCSVLVSSSGQSVRQSLQRIMAFSASLLLSFSPSTSEKVELRPPCF